MAQTTAPITAPTPANFAAVVALGLIWGGTFMVVAIALEGYGPVTVAATRTALGALALSAVAWTMRRPLPTLDLVSGGFFFAIGIATAALPFFLLAWGQQYVSSAYAGLSMAVLPLFVLPLAHVFVPGDQLSWRKASGFVLGLLGAVILLGPGTLAATGGDLAALGRLACLAASFCYATGSILTRRCPPMDPIWLSALTLSVGSAILVPAMLVVEGIPTAAAPRPTLALLLLGLVPTGFAALLRVTVIRSAGPSFMTLVNYQVPVWSMVCGWLVLSEDLPTRFFAALALILTGLILSQWRALRQMLGR